MERRITEEFVTKTILLWLKSNNWEIVCFDFPQSGTGVSLHPNQDIRESKNKGAIIPDIVAYRDNTVVFFENKDRFVFEDFIKVNDLRNTQDYLDSIERLLQGYNYENIIYGVGLPYTKTAYKKSNENQNMVDFVALLEDNNISIAISVPLKLGLVKS